MRALGRAVNIIAAACACAVVLGVLGFGYGPIPPLGPALDPGRGVWASAAGGEPVKTETLRLTGLDQPVTVSFSPQGNASIEAATDHDLFLALGYVHTEFRLAEMDEGRRLGEAQLAGPPLLASDKFELRLGLLRTAQAQWAQMPKASPPAQALLAYAQGVNDDIARVRASDQWPAAFSLAGVYPAWRKMRVVHYEIPLRGAATVHLTVDLTVHGPIMTRAGPTTSVDWLGNVPSPDLATSSRSTTRPTSRSSGRPWPPGTHPCRTSSTPTRPGTSARSRRATTRRSPPAASPGCRCQGPAPVT